MTTIRGTIVKFQKFVTTLVLVAFLSACGGGGDGGNDEDNDNSDTSPTNTDTTTTGIDLKLDLEKDDFWEFYWFDETTTFSQGSGTSSRSSFGIYRARQICSNLKPHTPQSL